MNNIEKYNENKIFERNGLEGQDTILPILDSLHEYNRILNYIDDYINVLDEIDHKINILGRN